MEEKKTLLLEGLLPTDVWNAIIVLLILFGAAVAILKGISFIRDEIEKSKNKKKTKKQKTTIITRKAKNKWKKKTQLLF